MKNTRDDDKKIDLAEELKITASVNDMLAFGSEDDYKRFKRAIKSYETIEFNKLMGKFIRDRRKELNLSPSDIALALNITYNAYNQYETGRISIPAENIFRIAKIMGVSLDEWLSFYFKNKKYPDNYKYFGDDKSRQEEKSIISVLDKNIDIIKEIYNSKNKKLISALNQTLDSVYQLLKIQTVKKGNKK